MFVRLSFTIAIFLTSIGLGNAHNIPEPNEEMCSLYRQGPLIHRRYPVYRDGESKDPDSFFWIDAWFRYEYVAGTMSFDMPSAEGGPNMGFIVHVDTLTGQPITDAQRRERPSVETIFTILLTTYRGHLPVKNFLSSHTDRDVSLVVQKIFPLKYHRTGEFLEHSPRMERVELENERPWYIGKKTYYAEFDDIGEITAAMECDVPGSVPVPHCRVVEKAKYFEMRIGSVRLNELYRLEKVRHHARNFVACLTWKGE